MSMVDADFLLSVVGLSAADSMRADLGSFGHLLVGQDEPSCDPCTEECGADASCNLLSDGEFTFSDFLNLSIALALAHFLFPVLYLMDFMLFVALFALLQAAIGILVVTWPFLLAFAVMFFITGLF